MESRYWLALGFGISMIWIQDATGAAIWLIASMLISEWKLKSGLTWLDAVNQERAATWTLK